MVSTATVPAVVFLNASTGRPDAAFGAGGFAFQAAVGGPAAVCPNGVAITPNGGRRAER